MRDGWLLALRQAALAIALDDNAMLQVGLRPRALPRFKLLLRAYVRP
jgi:hypothetical protein